ncbi:hypothetical protein [Staphylococcus phage PT1-4]
MRLSFLSRQRGFLSVMARWVCISPLQIRYAVVKD